MSDNPTQYEVLIEQYLRSILDISGVEYTNHEATAPPFYQSIKHRKSACYSFSPHYLYIRKQMKKSKPCITL